MAEMNFDALAVITDDVEQQRKVPGAVMITEEEDVDHLSLAVDVEDDTGTTDVG